MPDAAPPGSRYARAGARVRAVTRLLQSSGQIARELLDLPGRIVRNRPAAERDRLRAQDFEAWRDDTAPTLVERIEAEQRIARLRHAPRLSVLLPVYEVPTRWLERAIESVRGQSYPHWELCIADDGSRASHIAPLLHRLTALDPRIKSCVRPRNGGIATATNDALALATGKFVAFLDHDDELAPEALAEVAFALAERPDLDYVYSDEDKLLPDGRRGWPFFKPDWSPELLEGVNYACHLSVVRTSLVREIGGLRSGFDGAQDYDLVLRVTERTKRIHHIPKLLYHWRVVPTSVAGSADAKPYAYEAGRRALADALRRRGERAREVHHASVPGCYRVERELAGEPGVAIIIPTRDRADLLGRCVQTLGKTAYPRYEVLVVDNGSVEDETRRLFERWRGSGPRVISAPGPFNFSALNNRAVCQSDAPFLLFLNNDIEVTDPGWLRAMLEHAQRPEVGAVGARLLFPDGSLQHAGVALGIGGADAVSGVAGHFWTRLPRGARTDFNLGGVTRNVSAVTAACLLLRREVFDEVGGFDERLAASYNDVDLCLRIGARGYRIVYTPWATLIHHESATRMRRIDPQEVRLMHERWGPELLADPFFSPNLSLRAARPEFRFRDEGDAICREHARRLAVRGRRARPSARDAQRRTPSPVAVAKESPPSRKP